MWKAQEDKMAPSLWGSLAPGPGWTSTMQRAEPDTSCLLKIRGWLQWSQDQATHLCLLCPSWISVRISPLNPQGLLSFSTWLYQKQNGKVCRAPFWNILQSIFTLLGSLEVSILSRVDEQAASLIEWERPGPSEEPRVTRPVRCPVQLGMWHLVGHWPDAGPQGLLFSFLHVLRKPLFCSCYFTALVFLIFVFTSIFTSSSAVSLPLFFFFSLLLLTLSHFEHSKTHQEKQQERRVKHQ